MMRLATLLFLMYTLLITTVQSQIASSFGSNDPSFCCNPTPSAQIQSPSINLVDIVNNSPNYAQITALNNYLENLDNVCYTYFNIDDESYIQFAGLRYCDGSCLIEKFIVSSLPGSNGTARLQGLAQRSGSSTAVLDEQFIGEPCPGLYLFYRYYVAARCDILGNATQVQIDQVHADSSDIDVPECCFNKVAAMANSYNLKGGPLLKFPNRLNRCCVTQLNGVSCVNANRVRPQDSVTLPDQGSCSQIY